MWAGSAEHLAEAARVLGSAQITTGVWGAEVREELSRINLAIERNGPGVVPVPPDLLQHPEAEVLLVSFCPVSSDALDALPNLRIIGVARGGVENVDVAKATERGIVVVNAPGRNAEAVSDFAIGLLLAETRNIARGHHGIKSGKWILRYPNFRKVPQLRGKTMGLVGFGSIGRLVARKLRGFNMKVLVYDPFVTKEEVEGEGAKLVDKETLFKESDFVSIHARLTESSWHVVGKKELSLMKPTAYIINTARSGLVDTEALIEALSERRIMGAALDVFDIEPLPETSPLLTLDNVTLTPHLAGGTVEASTDSPRILVEGLQQVLEGRPSRAVVNPKALEDQRFQTWLRQLSFKVG